MKPGYDGGMEGRRSARQRHQRRELLERALARLEQDGFGALDYPRLAEAAGLALRSLSRAFPEPEDLFFPEHAERLEAFGRMVDEAGLAEACLAWARLQEEDRGLQLRLLEALERESRLRARRAALDEALVDRLAAHFLRWGAAGIQGERRAELEARLLVAALRGAEQLWRRGGGRPLLPVLVQEALALLWPALYAHARRHLD